MAIDLSSLNPKQQEAVLHSGRPLALIAGAGSGKTRCVVAKIARLIDEGVPPQYIMATAFTNKSADEMVERVAKAVGKEKALKLKMGTFHSICYRMYNDINKKIRPGYKSPELVRNGEKYLFMYNYVKSNEMAFKGIKDIYARIGKWKNLGLTADVVMKKVRDEFGEGATPQTVREVSIATCYKAYELYLTKNRKIDFDDMLLKTLLLLRSKEVAEHLKVIRRTTRYIIVDEFQDTNGVQYDIIDAIVGGPENCTSELMLVGDDYQLIYEFRGSHIDSIHKFIEKYKFEVITLEQNYRSTKKIVEVGNKLIAHNSKQIPKTLFTSNMEGEHINVFVNQNENFEADEITEKIHHLITEGFSYNDMAVIYRINAQSRAIVDSFVMNHIPHKVYSKYSFYERSEVKDILAYCKILYNPYEADKDDFVRICNKPTRYLSKDVMDKVHSLQIEDDYDTFWEALINSWKVEGLKPFQKQALAKFTGDIENFKTMAHSHNASTSMLIDMVMKDVGYEKWLKDSQDGSALDDVEDADEDQLLNLDALFEGAKRFDNPEDYFIYVEGLKKMQNKEKDFVHCMTIHKAKGLEFQVVFLIGFCDRIYPFYKALDEGITGIESERRVAYVGATRAKELLYLSTLRGTFGRFKVGTSPFIEQMGLSAPTSRNI